MAVNKQLLDILRCPICKGPLTMTENQDGLICPEDKLMFRIVDDIPVMIPDEAVKLDEK